MHLIWSPVNAYKKAFPTIQYSKQIRSFKNAVFFFQFRSVSQRKALKSMNAEWIDTFGVVQKRWKKPADLNQYFKLLTLPPKLSSLPIFPA